MELNLYQALTCEYLGEDVSEKETMEEYAQNNQDDYLLYIFRIPVSSRGTATTKTRQQIIEASRTFIPT